MTHRIKAGEALSIGFKYDGNGRKMQAKTIQRNIKTVYKDGRVLDSCGEIWRAKRTSAGIVAILMVLAFMTGCMGKDSVVFDEPERVPAREESREARVIQVLTDSGCDVTKYSSKRRLREVTITCKE